MSLSTRPSKKKDDVLKAAQILINNSNFIHQTNQSLQSLSEALISLSLQFEKQRANTASEFKNLQIEFEKLSDQVKSSCSVLGSKVGDLNSNLLKLSNECIKKFQEIFDNHSTLDDVAHIAIESEDRDTAIKNAIKTERSYVDSCTSLLRSQINAEIDSMRRDLQKTDPSPSAYELALESKIKEDAVTRDGLIKEIELLKKQCAYNAKQFEYVLTRIERLKGEA